MSLRLTLEVPPSPTGIRAFPPRAVFEARGGTIGRTPNNDLSLPAPGVSRLHAKLHWHEGSFLIEDCSANGMSLNGQPLPRQQPQPLRDGDRLTIDEFDVLVAIAALAPDGPPGDALAGDALLSSDAATPSLLDERAVAEPSTPQPSWNHTPGPTDHYAPPPAAAPALGGPLPENWDLSILQPKPPAAAPAAAAVADEPRTAERPAAAPLPSRPATPAAMPSGDALAELLRAAGLDPAQVTADTLRQLGEILRVVIDGTIEALRMRAQTKSEFRLDMTRAQARGNNPLKFAANVEDALHGLFARRNTAYLGPVEAFRDAFDDLHAHQLAMLAGFREAYQTLLREFEPETLRSEFEKQGRSATLLRLAGRARYWDLYEQHFAARMTDADDAFRELFGDPFSEAYERQFRHFRQSISRKGQPT